METRSKSAEHARQEVEGGPAFKKPRLGVGTAVAKFVPGPADNFLLVLAKTKAERLIPTMGKIIVTTRQETLPIVLRSMIDNNILSIVVLTKSGRYHGFIEIFDILKFVIGIYENLPEDQVPGAAMVHSKQAVFDKTTVADVIPSPRGVENPYNPCHIGYSLFHVWEILAQSGGHRVPVLDSNFTIWDIITQSMLVDFLWQNLEKVGTLATRTVGTMFSHLPQVVQTVSENTMAILAFRMMIEKKVRGIAVVNSAGRLVDNFSDRDLRVVYPTKTLSDFNVLWTKTVSEVKEIVRARYSQTPSKLLFVTPESTFSSLLEIMANMHVHRVFMVDSKEGMVPIRCISQTDVLGVILSEKI